MAFKKFLGLGTPAPLMDPSTPPGLRSTPWLEWFSRLITSLASIPNVVNSTSLGEQGASITTTDFARAILPAGVYRASYRVRVTRAATSSSSITVTLGWTDGGVALTAVGAALTGNTTGTYQQATVVLRSDAAAAVTFAVTYGSVGATSMQYAIDLTLERLIG